MSFLSKIFKKKPGGTFFGNLLRGVVKQIPVVGEVVGNGANKIELGQTKTNAQLAQEASLSVPNVSEQMSSVSPTPENIMANSGFPTQSKIFQTGQYDNPNLLNEVSISAVKPSTNISLDWKNGKIGYESGTRDNSALIYGMLGLGALVLLNKK